MTARLRHHAIGGGALFAVALLVTPWGIGCIPAILEDLSGMELSPGNLHFEATEGGPNPEPQVIRLINSGSMAIEWTTKAGVTKPASWLSVTPAGGSLPPDETVDLSVSVDATGLEPGVYFASVAVLATNRITPWTLVSLIVYPPGPKLSVSSASLSFTAKEGEAAPQSQTIQIANTGGQMLHWSDSPDAGWLSVFLWYGVFMEGESNSISVSVDPTGLTTAGSPYTATITMAAQNTTTAEAAVNTPQTVIVTLVVEK